MMKPQRGKTPGKKGPAPRPPRRVNSTPTDPVEVFCRIRPVDANLPRCIKGVSPTTIIIKPGVNSHSYKNGNIKESTYTFQHVYDEFSGQKAIFDHIAFPLAEDVLHGKNALLFAYGVTGSGKTHTMTGTPEEQGVLPRCLDVLFNSIEDLQAKKYVFKPDKMNGFDIQPEVDAMLERQRREIMPQMTNTPKTPRRQFDKINRVRDTSKVAGVVEDNNYAVFVSYVEIYNNYIYDLLEELPYDPISGHKPPQSKILREDAGHNMYVNGVTEIEVKSTEEAYDVLIKGQKRRKVAHTALNTESSRSHSVFNIRLVQAPLDPVGEEVLQEKSQITTSQISLVDLAGSERLLRTNNSKGDRQREAGNINQSLMVLRQCIEALRENQQLGRPEKMVPYRDSKVTMLFKNYFDGEGKVRMIVCVNPKEEEYDETIHVMKFAELTQEVQVARPQEHKVDVGLAPGRRRLNQKYKEAVAKAKEDGIDPANIPVATHLVYSMGPSFPKLELKVPSDEYTLQNLMAFLKDREGRRFTLLSDLSKKEERFRARLVDMERENEDMKQRLAELESLVEGKESEMKRVMKRVNSLERTKDALRKTATVYERERRDLAREVDDREWKIQQEKLEKDRLKQDFRARMVLTEHQMNDQMAREKKKLVEETQARILNKNRKLQMVKNILSGDTSDAESISSGAFATPVRPPRTTPRYATGGPSVYPARSEPDLTNIGGGPTSTPKPYHMRAKTAYSTNTINKAVPRTTRGPAPPPTKPKPRYHRRSKSAHEIWLEHRPAGTVDTGTLSQPQMKKRKSVTELKEKDTKKGVSKYVLTHQEVDSEGDFATKLVKGDVIPTAGGGTAVIFNDVEVIKQKSPGDRKRRSYEQLRPEDYSGEWSDPEDRCRVAIEGHGHMKRVKTSQV